MSPIERTPKTFQANLGLFWATIQLFLMSLAISFEVEVRMIAQNDPFNEPD